MRVVFLTLLLLSAQAFATVTLNGSWTQPSQNEDGSQLRYSEIAGYRVYFKFDEAPTLEDDFVSVEAGRETISQPIEVPEGQDTNTVYFAVTALTIYGGESKLSNIVSQEFTVGDPIKTPNAPTNVKISVQCDSACVVELVQPE